MKWEHNIEKPIKRSKLRQVFGKEYYIFKRKIDWYFGRKKWANISTNKMTDFVVFEHKSLILRPLLGVDMQLQKNKRTNLELAIKHLNGIEIKPGETFSIWKNVGRPTQRKGYLTGLVLKQGKIAEDIGGGLCQLGNLLFWMFAHSPLKITERYRHGFDVFPGVNRKVPFGAGATLSYNHVDLQVYNSTTLSFFIELKVDETHLIGRLFSSEPLKETFKIEERNHLIEQQFWGGYSRHNQIYKITTNLEGEGKEELLVENNAIMMYNPYLE